MRPSGIFISAIILFLSSVAQAGITIHFRGSLANDDAVEKVTELASSTAKENSWQFTLISSENISAIDSITKKIITEIDGPEGVSSAKGIIIFMHEMSEPLYLVFGPSRRIDNFVKTQFSSIDTHIKAVELLKRISPLFAQFDVNDESGYWATQDRQILEEELEGLNLLLKKILSERPDAEGPIKRPDGRILDFVVRKR